MISIIIPVYNVERFLKRCLDSVINQTFTDIEIILVDDGSPDDSPKICDSYALSDSRIKVVHKNNGGLSSARNAGLDICLGEYVFFMDSDDWLANNNVLEFFYKCAQENNADFVYAKLNSATEKTITPYRSIDKYSDEYLYFLSNPYYFSAWNKLYKTELFKTIRFENGRINEDVDIIPLICMSAKKIALLDKYTYNYYTNNESITRKSFSEKRFDMFKSVKHAYDNFIGTELQRNVFMQNLFGFQLFSVYISILTNTKGKDKKKYIIQFLNNLNFYNFKSFYNYCLKCFILNETFSKKIKKIIALILLKFYSLLYCKKLNNASK